MCSLSISSGVLVAVALELVQMHALASQNCKVRTYLDKMLGDHLHMYIGDVLVWAKAPTRGVPLQLSICLPLQNNDPTLSTLRIPCEDASHP